MREGKFCAEHKKRTKGRRDECKSSFWVEGAVVVEMKFILGIKCVCYSGAINKRLSLSWRKKKKANVGTIAEISVGSSSKRLIFMIVLRRSVVGWAGIQIDPNLNTLNLHVKHSENVKIPCMLEPWWKAFNFFYGSKFGRSERKINFNWSV